MITKLLPIFISASTGYALGRFVDTGGVQGLLSTLITLLVLTTIFPSMILFRFESAGVSKKPLLASLLINFVYSPLFALLILKTGSNHIMKVALASSLLMPVPSMNSAYVIISGGNLELTVSLMAVNFLTGVALYPLLLSTISGIHNLGIDPVQISETLMIVIVLPLLFGQVLRKFVTPSREVVSKFTEVSLNALVFTIFLSKASLIHPTSFIVQLPYSVGFILSSVFLSEVISKISGIKREEHLSYVFLSTGKNNSTVIAILTLALSPLYAVYVLFHQFIQIVLLLAYATAKAEKII
ncbi:bile acid:sodium symporter [Geoglobus acetivorans]|uniref:Bile acid:sodium symporter n=1 Tax=Geoglobus acetivorans TaxID=565033 RepID=A0ABZ3GZS5_GEOAI|nr:bile acid:sodium symporter [Geoglobus acetivorans]